MKSDIMSLLSDKITVPESLDKLSSVFKTAKPFPHIVIDNMFPDKRLDQLVTEIPSMTDDHWVHESNDQLEKYNLRSAIELGDSGFQLTAFLHSASFLYFLSELTGIWELLPDPYLQGSGYHLIPRGGKFDVHADRNTAYETGLTRRLSLIIYLNKDWKPEYGGQFELWNKDATRREGVVEPLFNRTVIFEIADVNFHGVPNLVACPKGRSRNSFVVYYHTVGVNGRRDAPPHTSIYAPSFYQNGSALRKMVRDVTPPIVLRTLRRVRDRRKLIAR
jgi:Rps23 Pro-64 3,4-dihydroxylase Tpa1-like proline 4-hydroxylase